MTGNAARIWNYGSAPWQCTKPKFLVFIRLGWHELYMNSEWSTTLSTTLQQKYSCIAFRQKFIFVCQSVWILYCWLHECFIFCIHTDSSQWPKSLFWFVPKTNTTSRKDCNFQANQLKQYQKVPMYVQIH